MSSFDSGDKSFDTTYTKFEPRLDKPYIGFQHDVWAGCFWEKNFWRSIFWESTSLTVKCPKHYNVVPFELYLDTLVDCVPVVINPLHGIDGPDPGQTRPIIEFVYQAEEEDIVLDITPLLGEAPPSSGYGYPTEFILTNEIVHLDWENISPGTGPTGVELVSIREAHCDPTGLKFYVLSGNSVIYEYALNSYRNFNPATMTYIGESPLLTDTFNRHFQLSDDGLHMMPVHSSVSIMRHYTLSSAWDITSLVDTVDSKSLTGGEGTWTGYFGNFFMNGDGTKWWIAADNVNTLFEYDMPTPYLPSSSVQGLTVDITEATASPPVNHPIYEYSGGDGIGNGDAWGLDFSDNYRYLHIGMWYAGNAPGEILDYEAPDMVYTFDLTVPGNITGGWTQVPGSPFIQSGMGGDSMESIDIDTFALTGINIGVRGYAEHIGELHYDEVTPPWNDPPLPPNGTTCAIWNPAKRYSFIDNDTNRIDDKGMAISPDGNKMYLACNNTGVSPISIDEIQRWGMTGGDPSTLVLLETSGELGIGTLYTVRVSPALDKLIVLGSGDEIHEYNMTAGNVSTLALQTIYDLYQVESFDFSDDGMYIYVNFWRGNPTTVYQFSLSAPYSMAVAPVWTGKYFTFMSYQPYTTPIDTVEHVFVTGTTLAIVSEGAGILGDLWLQKATFGTLNDISTCTYDGACNLNSVYDTNDLHSVGTNDLEGKFYVSSFDRETNNSYNIDVHE